MQLTDKETNILNRLEELVFTGQISKHCMVQIIERLGAYLNLETISNCARREGKSYNGILKTRKPIKVFGVKFVTE